MAVTAQKAAETLQQVKPFMDETARDVQALGNAVQAFGFDVNLARPPAYWIYIFNISPVEHIRYRPPQHPKIVLAACPHDKPYQCVARIPDVVNEKTINPDTGQVSYFGIRGERFATDLVNPSNLSDNCWTPINPEHEWIDGGTDDLTRRGVFWSHSEVPQPQELLLAKGRLEAHYRQQFQKAEDLARSGKGNEIGKEHHAAAEYLSMSTSWHVATAVPIQCPNCGESIKPGIAYHPSAIGGICVIDWKRTVAAGVRTKDQVPDEYRWWQEKEKEKDQFIELDKFRSK